MKWNLCDTFLIQTQKRPDTFKIMSHPQARHLQDHVTSTGQTPSRSCHIHRPNTFKIMSHPQTKHLRDHATSTDQTPSRSCHIHGPDTFKIHVHVGVHGHTSVIHVIQFEICHTLSYKVI